ncbi:unnamed protein product [Protopolystoma xenopodis]|uniref:Uncharacterized protein n=1 Tax=Protopolystoma xenopodis TaxID=117903 RepID=A0A448X1N6_9PLAT|nr:unnamed protein product [Protopolystoma xenopodis]
MSRRRYFLSGPIVQRRIGSRLCTHAHMHMRTYRPVLPLDLSMPLLAMGSTARHLPVTDGARRFSGTLQMITSHSLSSLTLTLAFTLDALLSLSQNFHFG